MHLRQGRPAAIVFLAALLGCRTSTPLTSSAPSVEEAVQHFLTAFNNLDWPAFRACFAPDATVFNPDIPEATTTHRLDGCEAIERNFQSVFNATKLESSGPPYMHLGTRLRSPLKSISLGPLDSKKRDRGENLEPRRPRRLCLLRHRVRPSSRQSGLSGREDARVSGRQAVSSRTHAGDTAPPCPRHSRGRLENGASSHGYRRPRCTSCRDRLSVRRSECLALGR
jgi:hypothetical protein